MMSIAFKEGVKIPPPAMDQIIVGANQDVRQVKDNHTYYLNFMFSIHSLCMDTSGAVGKESVTAP